MNRKQYLLSKLAEEANEVAQMALKCQQFGFDDRYPDNTSEKNSERLINELIDLQGIISMLINEKHLVFISKEQKIFRKIKKVNRYYLYAKQCGQITEE